MARALSQLSLVLELLYAFSNFMDEDDHAHGETGVVPNIHNGKQEKTSLF